MPVQGAGLAGVTAKTLSQVERGNTTPSYRTIESLSSVLEVNPMDVEEFAAAIQERQSKVAA
jgi:transcriptional regulator with XRE-family HTH domain